MTDSLTPAEQTPERFVPATFRQQGMIRVQHASVFVHAVAGGIEPGQHRHMRRQCLRNGGVGLTIVAAPASQCVEGGRLDAARVRPDRIRAGRVQGDEQHRWAGGDRSSRLFRPRASGHDEHGGDGHRGESRHRFILGQIAIFGWTVAR